MYLSQLRSLGRNAGSCPLLLGTLLEVELAYAHNSVTPDAWHLCMILRYSLRAALAVASLAPLRVSVGDRSSSLLVCSNLPGFVLCACHSSVWIIFGVNLQLFVYI